MTVCRPTLYKVSHLDNFKLSARITQLIYSNILIYDVGPIHRDLSHIYIYAKPFIIKFK